MKTSRFDFELPERLIATQPARPRDSARMLLIGDAPTDKGVRDLPQLLRAGDLMVFNNTRVIPARLMARRGEAAVEILLHFQEQDVPEGGLVWQAFARPAKKLRTGDVVIFAADFAAHMLGRTPEGMVRLKFDYSPQQFHALLAQHGQMPLPPYMKRDAKVQDVNDYQTIYAEHDGAVAAPTAGLHFTYELMEAIDRAGVERTCVTLHVGAGTFLPVKVDDTDDHVMHSERYLVSEEAAAAIRHTRERGGRIVAVGTTSLRVLESCADEGGNIRAGSGETRLFITPGYRFKAVDVLMSNFHLPRSTLFMLVCALAGTERMKEAYTYAISEGYRFYSYGDACWIPRRVDS